MFYEKRNRRTKTQNLAYFVVAVCANNGVGTRILVVAALDQRAHFVEVYARHTFRVGQRHGYRARDAHLRDTRKGEVEKGAMNEE